MGGSPTEDNEKRRGARTFTCRVATPGTRLRADAAAATGFAMLVLGSSVVAKARVPRTSVAAVGVAGLQTPAVGKLVSSLTVMDVGTPGVSVLLIRSLRADSEFSPFGVTGQAQHEIISSAGSNV